MIFDTYPNTIVSKHFLTSLYQMIKQQLPRKIEYKEKGWKGKGSNEGVE